MPFTPNNLPADKPREPRQSKPRSIGEQGPDIAAECTRAVRLECGPMGARSRVSDHEKLALVQSLALYWLERPERFSGRVREERAAELRNALRHNFLRDARAWRDSLEQVAIGGRTRSRTAKPKLADLVCETVAEQADRSRAWERARQPMRATSLDVLIDRHRTDDGAIDWEPLALTQERERIAGDVLPPAAYAAHSPELVERMADAITAESAVGFSDKQLDAIRVALTVAAGERCEAIALARGIGVATAKRRSAEGAAILRTLTAWGVDLVAIRRAAVAEMMAEDEAILPTAWEPRTVAEVDAEQGTGAVRGLVDAAIGEQRKRSGRIAAGGSPATAPARPCGPAADVLAYIARLEHAAEVMSAPAWSIDTTGARPIPAPASVAPASVTAPERTAAAERLAHRATCSRCRWCESTGHTCSALAAIRPREPSTPSTRPSRTARPSVAAPPERVALDWSRHLDARSAASALTLARRVSSEPTRARRVTRMAKIALTLAAAE